MSDRSLTFRNTYLNVLSELRRFISRSALEHIAKHNCYWHPDRYDMLNYLTLSRTRFENAFRYIEKSKKRAARILDIGGFWGVFPVTLARMGYHVVMTEKYEYYENHFEDVIKFICENDVDILDCDPVDQIHNLAGFDFVTCLAVLEHLPHSPKILMNNIRTALNEGGACILEVPNIAYGHKRLKLLFGRTVLPHIKGIYRSAVPFIGHHHEYTIDEVSYLLDESGFSNIEIDTYNYSVVNGSILHRLITWPKYCKETVIAYGEKFGKAKNYYA